MPRFTKFLAFLFAAALLSFGASAQVGSQEQINAQTGTTYTFSCVPPDAGKLVTFSNASAITLTIPQAGATCFLAGWWVDVENIGPSPVTVALGGTSLISSGGAPTASLIIPPGTGGRIFTDGSNYYVKNGMANIGATLVQFSTASFTANGSVATSQGNLGPAGAHTSIQKWLTIKDGSGATFYIPLY